jgi:hypothetical protein
LITPPPFDQIWKNAQIWAVPDLQQGDRPSAQASRLLPSFEYETAKKTNGIGLIGGKKGATHVGGDKEESMRLLGRGSTICYFDMSSKSTAKKIYTSMYRSIVRRLPEDGLLCQLSETHHSRARSCNNTVFPRSCLRSCTIAKNVFAVIAIARPAVDSIKATRLTLTSSMTVAIVGTASRLNCTTNASFSTDRQLARSVPLEAAIVRGAFEVPFR